MSALKKTVLVTQGMEPFTQRIAKNLPGDYTVVFGAEHVPQALLQSTHYISLPNSHQHTYIHEVLKIGMDRAIDVLLPLGWDEIRQISEAKALFLEYGIAVWSPGQQVLKTLPIFENPPRDLLLVLLANGVPIFGAPPTIDNPELSGVFAYSDAGDELALCTCRL